VEAFSSSPGRRGLLQRILFPLGFGVSTAGDLFHAFWETHRDSLSLRNTSYFHFVRQPICCTNVIFSCDPSDVQPPLFPPSVRTLSSPLKKLLRFDFATLVGMLCLPFLGHLTSLVFIARDLRKPRRVRYSSLSFSV